MSFLIAFLALLFAACQPEDVSPTLTQTAEPVEPSIPITGDEWLSQGESIFSSQCATCHGTDGEGMEPQFPALDGNAFVQSMDPEAVIEVVLNGREAMPSFRDQLSNEEIAQVVSYIRNAWTNEASQVAVEDVEALRQD